MVAAAGSESNETVAITGATGLIGQRLVSKLASQGARVKVLTRNPSSAQAKFVGVRNVTFVGPSDWETSIAGCTAVVNLAGEPIANRWDDRVKAEIVRSRVDTTKRLVKAINALEPSKRPKVFLSSSAIGFYGSSETATFNESSPSGNDFLADVCRKWEAAANEAQVDRVVIIRTGIVLAKEGGALGKMLPVFQLFAGGPLGSGRQWFSWIHRDDLVRLMTDALKDKKFKGVYNGTAPNPVRMGEMCAELGNILGRPSWLPVPGFALQTLLGEGAMVVLEGQKVLPGRATEAQFQFQYSDIRSALRSLVA